MRWSIICGPAIAVVLCLYCDLLSRAGDDRNVDVQPRAPARIAPGTVIGRGAPRGWSNLIVAAYPRIGHGDVEKTSDLVKRLGATLTFSMAANVIHDSPGRGGIGYRLEKVGWGLGARINGNNTVISYETCDSLGANLGFLGNEVLRRNEEGLQETFVQVAKSDSMVICDYGELVLFRGEHRWMVVRHGVLVSPANGRIVSLAWLLDISEDGRYSVAEDSFQLLPPNLQEDRVFNVKSDRFTLGIPAADAFAVVKIPQGTPIRFSSNIASLAAMRRFTVASFRQLETELRKSLAGKFSL